MQEKRENEIKTCTSTNKSIMFTQELSEELSKKLGGVEDHRLPSIPEQWEDSDDDAKSVDSTQKDLDSIFREPHEFTHLVPTYQILASQSNSEVEQNLGLVHSE